MDNTTAGLLTGAASVIACGLILGLILWIARLLWTVTGDVRALTGSVSEIQGEVARVTARVEKLEARHSRGGGEIIE